MPKAKKHAPRAKFDYSLDFKNIDMRKNPELYCIGLGEQGVLSVEPYKSEILPLWRFKTPDIAKTSSQDLKQKFDEYKSHQDFIGMDMTRKFIQMGVTRARRYANWSGGKKYTGKLDEHGAKIKVEKGPEDQVKAESARIFGVVLKQVQEDAEYKQMSLRHQEMYEFASKQTKLKKEEEETSSFEESFRSGNEKKTYATRASVKQESSS